MPGMDTADDSSGSSSSSHGSSNMMTMVFQTETRTPLYATSWTPTNAGAYAGTCIFLAVLAIIARGLVAFKAVQEARWLDREAARRYVSVNGKLPLSEQIASSPDARRMTLSENGVEETVVVVERKQAVTRPWRFSVDPVRACLDTIIVGIGYLLFVPLGLLILRVRELDANNVSQYVSCHDDERRLLPFCAGRCLCRKPSSRSICTNSRALNEYTLPSSFNY
jgi:hypothetical protein